jgi:hypothetical protein
MPPCWQSIAVQRSGTATRPLRPPFPGTRRDLWLPVPLKGAIWASRLAEIWRKSVQVRAVKVCLTKTGLCKNLLH